MLSIFYIAIVLMFSLGYRQNQPHALINYIIIFICQHIAITGIIIQTIWCPILESMIDLLEM